MSHHAQYQAATFGALLCGVAQNWDGALVEAAFARAPGLQLHPPAVAHRPDRQADTRSGEPAAVRST
jgi:hypothetical protein